MSDYIESIFKGIDILIDKRMEDLSFDTTVICTIVDDTECKNGKYRVTDGSISYIAYSDKDDFKSGEQVRVNIPKNDYSKKKFIIGKYSTDDESAPITYVSPLESVVNISGNLTTSILGKRQYGILANGPEKSKILWNDYIDPYQFRDLQANGIYNTLIIKADFKTMLYDYDYIEGDYGLRIDLLVRPSPDSAVQLKRTVELSSKEMFGNPYNFTIFSPQAKTFSIVSAGIIEGIELSLYQNGNFKDSKGQYTKPFSNMLTDNIIVTNIELGLGSNILDIEDNVVRIYSENSLQYDFFPHSDSSNLKKIGLVWYNKDEHNQYVGFNDGLFNPVYDEIEYLKESYQDTRLLAQRGKIGIPEDKKGLTFAANVSEAKPILEKITSMLTQDLCSEFNYFRDLIADNTSPLYDALDLLRRQVVESIAQPIRESNSSYINLMEQQYQKVLNYIAKTTDEKPVLTVNYYKTIIDLLKTPPSGLNLNTYDVNNAKCTFDWVWDYFDKIYQSTKPVGYKEIYDNFKYRITLIINKIEKIISTLPEGMINDYDVFCNDYIENGRKYSPYAERDLSKYDNQYCIYWYRWEKDYVDPEGNYKLMPDGWRRLEPLELLNPNIDISEEVLNEIASKTWEECDEVAKKYLNLLYNVGLPHSASENLNDENKFVYETRPSENDEGFIYRYMQNNWQEEKYVAVVCYNHSIYVSNELIFSNSQEVIDEATADKGDVLQFEHVEGQNSNDSYQIYNESYYLRDSADEYRERELRCHYDGLRHKDEALQYASIYWYIPLKASMITFDREFLINKGFDTDLNADGTIIQNLHYSKDNYVCFYKQIQMEKQGTDLIFNPGGQEYDERSFWYKIKPTFQPSDSQNYIICKVILAGEITPVESKQYFTFGLAGNNGTKYTFAITNATPQGYIDGSGNDKELLLNISLRDANNTQITVEDDPQITWLMHTQELDIANQYLSNVHQENSTFSIESHEGCGILQAYIEVKLPDKDNPDDEVVENENYNTTLDPGQIVELSYMHSVPWSAGNYYISGPTIIIYNNYGTLDKTSMFDKSYQLFNGEDHSEILGVSWSLEYYRNDYSGQTLSDASEKEQEFYRSYLPFINSTNGLTPSTIYLENLEYVPVLIGTKGSDILWRQPIIINQNRYPSPLLNEWNGKFELDKENGTILSTMIGAGKKNPNNTFDGVLMGNVAAAAGLSKEGLGLYGFNDGAQSFGLNIDGTAFFGKAGRGRIEIDGNKGTIGSASYIQNMDTSSTNPINKAGMLIDLDDGLIDILGTTEITADVFNRMDEAEKRGYNNYDDYKARYGPIYIPILQESQSHIRISAISPYFFVKSAQNTELIHISDNQYFLQSENYKAGSYTTEDGVKINETGDSWVNASGDYVNIDGEIVNSSTEAKANVGEGMKINLKTGNVDAYKLKISSQNVLLDSTSINGPYLLVKSNKGNNLLYVSSSDYYLKTDNYSDYIAPDLENGIEEKQGSGLKIDLKYGIFNAYNKFTLMAGMPGSTSSVYLSTQNLGKSLELGTNQYSKITKSNWRFTVGNNFGVANDGFLFAQTGSIAGWNMNPYILYKKVYIKESTVGGKKKENLVDVNDKPSGTVLEYKTFMQNVGAYDPTNEDASPVSYAAFGVYKTKGLAQSGKFVASSEEGAETKVFYVNNRGHLHAESADITGKITASDGKIGGWTITGTTIANGNTILKSYADGNGSMSFGAGGKCKIDSNGKLTASGVELSGQLTAEAGGKIGAWYIDEDGNMSGSAASVAVTLHPAGVSAGVIATWNSIAALGYYAPQIFKACGIDFAIT